MKRLLFASFIAAALAACKIGGSDTTIAGGASCTEVAGACAHNADCCSYGCKAGVCVANPVEGGTCRTSNDCAYLRLCKSGHCTTGALCRDDADVCTSRYECCSGDCVGGSCTVNHAPVANAGANVPDAPYTQLFTLTNQSTDPDGDPMTFGWSFVSIPAGSTAVLSSTIAATPSFTPDKTGPYVVHLVVTDGPSGVPNRLSAETWVTITVVNRPPVITATAPAATWSRNVAVTISGTVTDPDGDALQCAWRVTPPDNTPQPFSALTFTPCGNPSTLSTTFTPTVEGLYTVDLVAQDQDRTTNAVVNTVLGTATFTSVNDPPTPQVTQTPYYANLGASGSTPDIIIDASPSYDINGDAPLSYYWEMISASDGGSLPALNDPVTATTVSFVANREVDYVVRVTETDPAQFGRAGASNTLDVTVRVGRYIQQLSHDVIDAARATAVDKVVLGGHDPSDSSKGALWVYDLSTGTGTEGAKIPLLASGNVSGIPSLVGVTPDGTKAVVVDSSAGLGIWVVTLGNTPSMTRIAAPWSVGDLVVAGNKFAYLFKSSPGSSTDYIRELDLTNNSLSTPTLSGYYGSGYGGYGAAYSYGTNGTNTYLFRVDSYLGYWYRYDVNNGVSSSYSAWSSSVPGCGKLWPTLNATFLNSYVIGGCGDVYSSSSTTLGSVGNIGFSPADVDSADDGSVVAVDSIGPSLKLLNGALSLQETDPLPRWADNGYGRSLWVIHTFMTHTASKRIVVVHDTAIPPRYGIITYP